MKKIEKRIKNEEIKKKDDELRMMKNKTISKI